MPAWRRACPRRSGWARSWGGSLWCASRPPNANPVGCRDCLTSSAGTVTGHGDGWAVACGLSAVACPAMTDRIWLIAVLFALLMGVFLIRLIDLQIVQGERLAKVVDDSRLVTEVVPPRRGRILDRTGT